jgi:hypothetical protein
LPQNGVGAKQRGRIYSMERKASRTKGFKIHNFRAAALLHDTGEPTTVAWSQAITGNPLGRARNGNGVQGAVRTADFWSPVQQNSEEREGEVESETNGKDRKPQRSVRAGSREPSIVLVQYSVMAGNEMGGHLRLPPSSASPSLSSLLSL